MKIESKYEVGDIVLSQTYSNECVHTYDPFIIIDIDHYDSESGFVYKCIGFRNFQSARENNQSINDFLFSIQRYGFKNYDLISERLLFRNFDEIIDSIKFFSDAIKNKIELMEREKDLYFETFIKK